MVRVTMAGNVVFHAFVAKSGAPSVELVARAMSMPPTIEAFISASDWLAAQQSVERYLRHRAQLAVETGRVASAHGDSAAMEARADAALMFEELERNTPNWNVVQVSQRWCGARAIWAALAVAELTSSNYLATMDAEARKWQYQGCTRIARPAEVLMSIDQSGPRTGDLTSSP